MLLTPITLSKYDDRKLRVSASEALLIIENLERNNLELGYIRDIQYWPKDQDTCN